MQDVNPNAWGSWSHSTPAQNEVPYDMYPATYGGNPTDTSPLTMRASRQEAACKGWDLSDTDEAEATQVAVAERVSWESSVRPLGSMVARRTLETPDEC